jgi:hypothetical protein
MSIGRLGSTLFRLAAYAVVLAALSPRDASGTSGIKFLMTVPVGSSQGKLYQTYHANYYALDWAPDNDAPEGLKEAVSTRAWGVGPHGSRTYIGAIWRARVDDFVCTRIDAQYWVVGELKPRAKHEFLHVKYISERDDWVGDLFVSQWGEQNYAPIGWMVHTGEEKPGCGWTGIHVHERSGGDCTTDNGQCLQHTWQHNLDHFGSSSNSAGKHHYVWEVWPFQDLYPDHNDWTRSVEW